MAIVASGESVRELQIWLNKVLPKICSKVSCSVKSLSVDGLYGSNTIEAVKELQKYINASGAGVTLKVDGYYGLKTEQAAQKVFGTAPPAVFGSFAAKPKIVVASESHDIKKYLLIAGGLLLIGVATYLIFQKYYEA